MSKEGEFFNENDEKFSAGGVTVPSYLSAGSCT